MNTKITRDQLSIDQKCSAKKLINAVRELNVISGSPDKPYIRSELGKLVSQVNHYVLEWGIRGCTLLRIINTVNDTEVVFKGKYMRSKEELYECVQRLIGEYYENIKND